MTNIRTTDPNLDVSKNLVDGHAVIHQSGHNRAVTTTFSSVSEGGIFQTPQVSGATPLRIKAGGNAQDGPGGTGAIELTLQGLDATGAEISETLLTAGAAASLPTSLSFFRLARAFVSKSGTYASMGIGSHVGEIVIEDSAGTADWAVISAIDTARGQTTIGSFTIPLGKTGFIESVSINVNTIKTANLMLLARQNVLETVAPFSASLLRQEVTGLTGSEVLNRVNPARIPELTDICFLAKVEIGMGDVSVDFDLTLVNNT